MAELANDKYKSRIAGYGEEDPSQLLANPYNFRVHTREQSEILDAILEEVGWVQTVVVNKRTSNLVDGHLRVMLAVRNGEESVPVTYVDLSEAEERRVIALYDRITSLATIDDEKLRELMELVIEETESIETRLDELLEEFAAEVGAFEVRDSSNAEQNGSSNESSYIEFRLGNYKGRVSEPVFRSFEEEYKRHKRDNSDLVMIDDILTEWLSL